MVVQKQIIGRVAYFGKNLIKENFKNSRKLVFRYLIEKKMQQIRTEILS